MNQDKNEQVKSGFLESNLNGCHVHVFLLENTIFAHHHLYLILSSVLFKTADQDQQNGWKHKDLKK